IPPLAPGQFPGGLAEPLAKRPQCLLQAKAPTREKAEQEKLGLYPGGINLGVGKKQLVAAFFALVLRWPKQVAPKALRAGEVTALKGNVTEAIQCLVGLPAAERLFHESPERSGVAVGEALVEPFAGLAVHSVAINA